MSAKKTGGHGASLKAKNSAMAARMKADGVERATMKCPLCNRMVGIKTFGSHILGCRR